MWFVSHSSCRKAEAYTCVPIEGGDGPYDGPHQSPNRVAKLAPDPVVIRRLLLSRVVFERARRTVRPFRARLDLDFGTFTDETNNPTTTWR